MPGDAAALGRVTVTSWLSGHEGQMPDEAWLRRAADWTPEVSAQGWARVLADQVNGVALLRAAALELIRLGFSTIRLEVLSANLPARAFYEQVGGRETGRGAFDEDGYVLPVTIYEWAIGSH